MTAIYKRELRSYFHSMIGCIFIAFLLAFTGIYFTAYNLQSGYPYFAYTLSGVLFVFIVGIPLLTMKSFSEERKNKTDQMLLTAPISLTKIVFGKYFSMVTVLAIPHVIFCVFPLIIKMNGNAYPKVDYPAIFTFFLLGCVFLAIGMFISALTESQIIAYIGTFGILLVIFLWNGITGFLPSQAVGNMLGLIVILSLIVVCVWKLCGNLILSLGLEILVLAGTVITYFVDDTLYENLLTTVLGRFALSDVFTKIYQDQILDMTGIMLYLSIIVIFIFLTVQAIQKKRNTSNAGMTALVLAIVVAANLIVGQIPEQYRNLDVSSTNLYEISDTSTEFLSGLEKEIKFTIYAVEEDTDERLKTFISKYTSYTDQISVEWVDPVLHPAEVEEAGASSDTILVSCEEIGQSTLVYFSDIIVYDQYSYYYYGTATEQAFDGEGQLTSAINYVTNEERQHIYRTAGHGESTFTSSIQELMDKNLYDISELNLLMETEIPEDCDLIVMYAPETDITEDELNMIKEYMAAGGDFLLLIGDTNVNTFTNLSALMAEYGVESADGYIADTERCYQGNPYYIFPNINAYDELGTGMTSNMVLMIYAHGLNLTDPARDSISQTEFMYTSDDSYAVTDVEEVKDRYTIGVTATEELDEGTSKFTVISGGTLIDSQIIDSFTSLDNTTLFMNVVTSNFDGVENLSIEAKSLEIEYNTVQYVGLLSLLVIFGIPVVILISGFVVWFRRRKA